MVILPLLLAIWVSASNSEPLLDELVAIKEPIERIIINLLSSQCTTVKEILNQDYGDVSPDLSKLTLEFHTRNISIIYNLTDAAELIPQSRWFKHQRKMIIYIHGFTDSPRESSYKNISRAFLKQDDCNVLALDASSLLGLSTLYVGATTNIRYIGEILGAVLAKILEAGTTPSSIYLIGHSLGAHIAGFTGKTFTALTGERVGRITGLDPAGPCFTTVDDDLKLNRTDADLVDVIHSDAGFYGLDEQIGDLDFYPNSGYLQPKCFFDTCSHRRAWLLFAESVLFPQSMPAVSCDSWADFKKGHCNYSDISLMGFACNSTTGGKYYLQTAGSLPYNLGEDGIKYQSNRGSFLDKIVALFH